MIGTVKVDKLRVGYKNSSEKIANKIDEVLESYYEKYSISKEANQLTISVTPTKQLRNYYDGYNHNLQMIPLDQFLEFLKELRKSAGRNLTIYLLHLAKDVLMHRDIDNYLDNLLNHEYVNGYVASNTASSVSEENEEEDDSWSSFATVYIAKKKELDSGTPQKLVIKFFYQGPLLFPTVVLRSFHLTLCNVEFVVFHPFHLILSLILHHYMHIQYVYQLEFYIEEVVQYTHNLSQLFVSYNDRKM